MKQTIYSRIPRPTNNSDMLLAIQEEWDKISSEKIYRMVASMPECIQAVLDADGGHPMVGVWEVGKALGPSLYI